jgi:hypothetical protein
VSLCVWYVGYVCAARFLRGTSSARPPRLPAANPQGQWRQGVAGFFRIRGSYTKEKLFPQCGAAVSMSRCGGLPFNIVDKAAFFWQNDGGNTGWKKER